MHGDASTLLVRCTSYALRHDILLRCTNPDSVTRWSLTCLEEAEAGVAQRSPGLAQSGGGAGGAVGASLP
jgi:hypothetical protein